MLRFNVVTRRVYELEQTTTYIWTLGDRTGSSGFTLRHPALTSVRVPSGPPLALCYPDSVGDGLPGDQEADPQGSGCQKHTASIQRDDKDRGLWPHERTEPRDGSLCDVSTQTDPICMVRTLGEVSKFKVIAKRKNPTGQFTGFFQVCTRESPCGLVLPFLRRVDVWCHTVGDVHVLRGALVWSFGPTGTRVSATRDHLKPCPLCLYSCQSACLSSRLECVPTLMTFEVTLSVTFVLLRSCGGWNGRANVWRTHQIAPKKCMLSWGSAGHVILLTDPTLPNSPHWWRRCVFASVVMKSRAGSKEESATHWRMIVFTG